MIILLTTTHMLLAEGGEALGRGAQVLPADLQRKRLCSNGFRVQGLGAHGWLSKW